jgi:Fic family protein
LEVIFLKYRSLKSIWHENKEIYELEKKNRKNSFESVHLPLPIHDQPSYYVPDINAINLIETIHTKETQVEKIYYTLPDAAKDMYSMSCLIDEIHFTNDIEGIRSTRQEIKKAYDLVQNTGLPDTNTRFSYIVNKYDKFIAEELPLNTPEDIRNLYDEIILPEIDPTNYPDGHLFRIKNVYIVDASGDPIHRGVTGETAITDAITKALSVLKINMPAAIQIAVLHYYIGYIHPFYDGNGRLNRFISSYLLSKTFDPVVSYRLSYTIQKNKTQYYRAFETCNDKINAGDITPFVLSFMDIINKAIDDILEKMQTGTAALERYRQILEGFNLSHDQKDLLFYLIQNAMFSIIPFDAKTLAVQMAKSPETIKRNINALIQKGYPINVSREGHKNIYRIDLEKLYTSPSRS